MQVGRNQEILPQVVQQNLYINDGLLVYCKINIKII